MHSVYLKLRALIAAGIIDGTYPEGSMLPSVRALAAEGLLDDTSLADSRQAPPDLVVAAHRFVARTPARLMAVRLEDLAGDDRPVNLPSTADEYPNWRPKLPGTIEAITASDMFGAIVAGIRAERPGKA